MSMDTWVQRALREDVVQETIARLRVTPRSEHKRLLVSLRRWWFYTYHPINEQEDLYNSTRACDALVTRVLEMAGLAPPEDGRYCVNCLATDNLVAEQVYVGGHGWLWQWRCRFDKHCKVRQDWVQTES